MGRKCRIVGTALLCCWPTWADRAAAEEKRTEELARECRGEPPAGDLGLMFCIGYLSGLTDMHALMSDARLGGGRSQYCIPETGISNEQAMKVFLKWADDHPEQLHKSARISVLIAFREAFPCP
jgi:hypothetical protein